MTSKRILALVLVSWMLVSCQPEVVLVDVTRIVEVPVEVDRPVAAQTTPTAAARADDSELVTPEISQVVTRVITSTIVEEVVVEVTKQPLGSAVRPVQLLFAPAANTSVIGKRAQGLLDYLAELTGLQFEAGVLDSESSVIRLMCTAPADTIGFLSAAGYVAANKRCGAEVGNVAVHEDGLSWSTGMIVARRDSGITSLEDLAGKRWAVPDSSSISQYLFFQAMLAEAGIEVGEVVEVPGDSSAMLAVFNGDADFATAEYVPPVLPFDERPWAYGEDSPEVWRRVGISPRRSPIGYVLVNGEPEFGGYRLRDARSRIFDIEPGIYDETLIVVLSEQIPNETIALGADFPLGPARQILAALIDFSSSDVCLTSLCSADFYGWIGMESSDDGSYDPLRFVFDTLDLE